MLSGCNQEVGDNTIRHLSNIEVIISNQEIELSLAGDGRSDVEIFESEPLQTEIDNHTDFPVRGLIVNDDRAFLDMISGNPSSIGGQGVTSLLLFLKHDPRANGGVLAHEGGLCPGTSLKQNPCPTD